MINADNDLKISISGHIDNTGNKEHNQKLSEARAETVKKELLSKGISAERLQAKGFGQGQPITDNATEDGKEKNRRVKNGECGDGITLIFVTLRSNISPSHH